MRLALSHCTSSTGPKPCKSGKLLVSANSSWRINNYSRSLVSTFSHRGFDVIVVSPNDEHTERLTALGCRHIPVNIEAGGTNPIKDALLFLQYCRIMQQERPDVFLGWTIKPNIYGGIAANLMSIPVINNISGLGTAFISKGLMTRVAMTLYKLALRRSDCVFFQNKDDEALFVSSGLVRTEQTGLLPGSGVDSSHFRPIIKQTEQIATKPVFILVSRLIWDKGIAEFIEAARIVRRTVPEARFQLLGPLEVENRTVVPRRFVESWVNEGLIEYLGVAEDVRPHIALADCVVLPSYREGTPRCLLEAAAMAKPLIATDVPGCREVVDDGKNGFLCEARNSKDLASKMLKFIQMDALSRKEMGSKSRKKAKSEFVEAIIISKYLEVIDRLIR